VPGSVPRARRHARRALSEWNLGTLGEAAELVVSELVTNAIRASRDAGGHRPVRLWLAAGRARVAVGVWDGSPDPPVPGQPSDTDESGRGLLLVEAVSTAWDWYPEDGGKIVRALLDSGHLPSAVF
jgi:anti-sigma regulatory factor (Ser/Thr protein kinase)